MQAFMTGVWGLANVVGPIVGGVIVDRWSWRWVFYLNLPLGVVVVALVLGAFRETAPVPGGRRLDLAGTVTFLGGVTALLFLCLQPGGHGAATPAVAPGWALWAALAVGCLAAFVMIERRSADPLLPLGLFREPAFAVGSVTGFFAGAAMFGALVHVPLLVQWGQGTDATTAGLTLMSMSSGWTAGGLVAGQSLHRLGFWGLAVSGMALMTAGYAGLALGPGGSWRFLLWTGGVVGVGMGLASITLIVAVQTLVRPARRGVATSGVLFFRNVGATLGVALMGAALTARLGVDLVGLGAGARAFPPGLAAALIEGMRTVFWVGTAATALGLLAMCFLPRGSPAALAAAAEEVLG
jgi:MFS family permease